MGAKSDTLEKHARKRVAKADLPHLNVKKDEYYINPKCGHLKAVRIYNAQSLNRPTILQQVSVLHLSHVFFFWFCYMPSCLMICNLILPSCFIKVCLI
jgi:hypothetical protein